MHAQHTTLKYVYPSHLRFSLSLFYFGCSSEIPLCTTRAENRSAATWTLQSSKEHQRLEFCMTNLIWGACARAEKEESNSLSTCAVCCSSLNEIAFLRELKFGMKS
jgi:hypothetical protein